MLGLSVGGRTWVLCNPAGTQSPLRQRDDGGNSCPATIRASSGPADSNSEACSVPKEIHYHGHYPMADMEFEIGRAG